MNDCYKDFFVVSVLWIPFIVASAKYLARVSQAIENFKQDLPQEWDLFAGHAIEFGRSRGARLFWLILIGPTDPAKQSTFFKYFGISRLYLILCLVTFTIGIVALLYIPEVCTRR